MLSCYKGQRLSGRLRERLMASEIMKTSYPRISYMVKLNYSEVGLCNSGGSGLSLLSASENQCGWGRPSPELRFQNGRGRINIIGPEI
jgi:hypothetical protein